MATEKLEENDVWKVRNKFDTPKQKGQPCWLP